MRVLVPSGTQMGKARFVQASTTMTGLLVSVAVNPNGFVRTPELAPLVCTCGFHITG